MKNKKNKITRIVEKSIAIVIILIVAFVAMSALNRYLPQNLSKLSADVSATNGWHQEGDNWYYYENGTMIVSDWKQIDNYWYYFDDNGKMVKEWQQINNYWYYFGTDGRMRINWQQINTIWYYFGSDGKMKTGWVRVNNHSYYLTKYYREFDNNVQGQLVTGRRQIDGSYYYLCEKDAVAGYPEGAMLHNASYNGYSYYENGKEGLGPTTYYDTTLPSYYDSVLPNTISQIQSKTSINGALSFIYITDQHFYANSRNNAELIRRVYNNSNISYVFNGGDVNYAYGTEFERDLDVNNFIQFSDSLLSNNIDVYSVKGNHDYTTKQSKDSDVRYTLDPVAEYNVLMQGTKASNVHGPVNKAYYYYDDTANRVRYIVLDVFERDANPGYLMTGYFTDAQFNWFKDALTSIQNYNIVVFTHAPVDPNIQYYERSVSFIHDVEAAINNKNTYTYTYKEGNLAGTTTTLNFTNTTNRVLANISGHGHEDASAFTDNVLSVETTSDAYYNDDPNTPRQKNSVTEHAFDVYTIDFNGKKIYTTRVGAGVNRSFDFPSEISTIDIPTCSAKTYNGTTQTLMTNGTGYTVTNNTGTNAGNYTVNVTPNQYYKWSDGTTGVKNITCTIKPYSIKNADVVPISSYTYDGYPKEPVPSVMVDLPSSQNPTILTSNDYNVTYSNNTNIGTASVTITGKGNYTGTVTPLPTFIINEPIVNENDIYDVILFWGQSNMVGSVGCASRKSTDTLKGEDVMDQRLEELGIDEFSSRSGIDRNIIENYTTMSHVEINFDPNTVYDYKYLSNNMEPISTNTKAVGEVLYVSVNDGNVSFVSTPQENFATNKACGTNMTQYFSKIYHKKTGHKVIIVHVANGGEELAHFLPHDRVLVESQSSSESSKNQYIYEAMVEKYNAAIQYLNNNSLTIGNKFYVAFQGETDANYANNGHTTAQKYEDLFEEIHTDLKNELGLQFGVLVETSRATGTCFKTGVDIIHTAQENIIRNNNDIVLGSSFSYDHFVPCASEYTGSDNYETAKANALLSVSVSEVADNSIHFNSAGLSQIGKEAATNAIDNLSVKVTFHKNVSSDSTATQTFKYGTENQKFGYREDGITPQWDQTGQFGGWDRNGYKLIGWSEDKDAIIPTYDTVYYDVTNEFVANHSPNVDLYAIWKKIVDEPTCSAKTYNGQSQILLNSTASYTASNNTGINAGVYVVNVTPTTNYIWENGTTQSKEVICVINPKELDQSKFTTNNTSKIYDGNNTSNIVLISNIESGLVDGDSALVNYENATYNNVNVSNATTINVSGININNDNYSLLSDEQAYSGSITRKEISIPTCSAKTYNKQEQILFPSNTSGEYTNIELSGTNAGDYTVTLTPTSNYMWSDGTTESKDITCTINPYNITDADVVPISDYTYDGTAKEPVPSIIVDIPSSTNTSILTNTDYDVTYTNNTNAGTASLTITGKGNYTGIVNPEPTFIINKANGYITLNKTNENVLYGTSSTTFDILTNSGEISVSDDNETATTSITGNTVTVNNISTLSTGTIIKVEVTSASNQNYKQAKITYTLKITSTPITGGSVLITGNNIVGNTLTANVTDTVPVANYTYQWYRDTSQISGATSSTYTVASTDAGKTIKVEVTATKENYDSITFEDTTDVTNNKTQTVKEGVTNPTNSICNEVIYNGTSQTLATIPSGDSLKYGLLNNSGIEAGSYTLTARLNEGYIWSNGDTADVTFTCSIEKYNMQNATVEEIADQTYTGSEIRPEIVVRADSRMLQKDIDYTIEYSNNINIGTANITITGKGNYTGEKTSTFNIVVDVSKLNIKENTYVILNKDSTKDTITELIETNVSIFRNDVEINNTSKLATGDILRISNKEYTIVILGDTNKDGKVNIADLTRTYKIYKKTYTPNEIEFYAADSNEDERINISDLTRTYKIYKNN